jgi:hypothetical protein
LTTLTIHQRPSRLISWKLSTPCRSGRAKPGMLASYGASTWAMSRNTVGRSRTMVSMKPRCTAAGTVPNATKSVMKPSSVNSFRPLWFGRKPCSPAFHG